jgi:DNA-binding Xre family transcriptional regulator
MTYTNTPDILNYIRQLMVKKRMQVKDIAINMNKSQGATSALLRQENISLESLNEICQAMDCQLVIDIVPMDRE